MELKLPAHLTSQLLVLKIKINILAVRFPKFILQGTKITVHPPRPARMRGQQWSRQFKALAQWKGV